MCTTVVDTTGTTDTRAQALGTSLRAEENRYSGHFIEGDNKCEMRAFHQLRYRYFVHERGWIPSDADSCGWERDRYDSHARHLGIFEDTCPVAYLRVLPDGAPTGLMLDHEFRCLLSEEQYAALPREHSVEISRLVIAPDTNEANPWRRNRQIMELLLKLLYELSLAEGYKLFFIEVETSWLRPFARRYAMPFISLNEPYTFPDGTETVAAYASLHTLEQAVMARCMAKYEWYAALR